MSSPQGHHYPGIYATGQSRLHLGDKYQNYYIRIDEAVVAANSAGVAQALFDIGAITSASQNSWQLYKSCKDGPQVLQAISSDLNLLRAVLQECEEVFSSITKQSARAERLCLITNGCNDTFRDLDTIVSRYHGFGLQQKRTWERMGWDDATLMDLRNRITVQTNLLTTFMATSQIRVEQKLEELIQEYRSGRKENSIVSRLTVDSLDADQRAQWRTIRKELEDHGITLEMFNANKDFILSWISKAISEHSLQEDVAPSSQGEMEAWSIDTSSGGALRSRLNLSPDLGTQFGFSQSPITGHGARGGFTSSIKKKIKSVISEPEKPMHMIHVSFDRRSEQYVGLPKEWEQYLQPGTPSAREMQTISPAVDSPTHIYTDGVLLSDREKLHLVTTNEAVQGRRELPRPVDDAFPTSSSSIFPSVLPIPDTSSDELDDLECDLTAHQILFTAASIYDFNIDRSRREAGFPYLSYVAGEVFDILGEKDKDELWLGKNQEDTRKQIGWLWQKHFVKLEAPLHVSKPYGT